MLSKRILLIDDEVSIHKIVRAGLMLEGGWTLLTASSGDEGITIALTEQPDAILLDVMMPGRDGTETFELLQESLETCNIPIIFLTAKTQAVDRKRFYALGARGVISKPFDPLTLSSQIAGYLAWE